MCRRIIFLIILIFVLASSTFAKDIPYTQEDRDRLIRVEEGLKAVNQRIDGLEKSINQRFESLEKRIDGLQNLIYVVISGIFVLIGFVLWDRRTALAPAVKKSKELEEKQDMLEKALKELGRKNPDVAEVLKHVGLL